MKIFHFLSFVMGYALHFRLTIPKNVATFEDNQLHWFTLFIWWTNHIHIFYFVHLSLLAVYALKLSLYVLLQINNNETQV